ncbi:MAG: type 4a pilus biogenesis protein PilO [Nitriliruptoraceae bacterium]|nr:type 4a pilus biogenesis protein PilO [Nitriliruptoraceae bacterium]
MTRIQIILAALGAVLLVAVFYLLLWQPQRDELADLEDQIATVEQQQTQARAEIARLEEVRRTSPELEAELAAAHSVLPTVANVPTLLRQLQLAADDADVTLQTVTTGRPIEAVADPSVADITLNVSLQGSYFEIVDFLRRVEDPTITARAVIWDSMSVSAADYPQLTANLTGRTFAVAAGAIPADPVPEAEQPVEDQDGDDALDEETLDEQEDVS